MYRKTRLKLASGWMQAQALASLAADNLQLAILQRETIFSKTNDLLMFRGLLLALCNNMVLYNYKNRKKTELTFPVTFCAS